MKSIDIDTLPYYGAGGPRKFDRLVKVSRLKTSTKKHPTADCTHMHRAPCSLHTTLHILVSIFRTAKS